jgi:CSLREA domain-containing protein
MHIYRIWLPTVILGFTFLFGATAQAATFTVDDFGDSVDANPGDGVCANGGGFCSLRAAIQETNALVGPDTVNLSGAVILDIAGAGEDLAATGDLDVTDDLTITGAGEGVAVITQTIGDRVFDTYLKPSGSPPQLTLLMTGVTLTGGAENFGAGVIVSADTTLDLRNSTVSGNTSTGNGAGIYIEADGTVELTGSTVSNNTSDDNGGGFYNLTGELTLNDSTVSDNNAENGGGVYNFASGANLTLNDSIVRNNTADDQGGGLYNNSGNLTLNDSTVSDNTCGGYGGGLYGLSAALTLLNDSIVSGNMSDDSGGGIYALVGEMILNDSTVSGNTSGTYGGGIRVVGGVQTINGSDITSNDASDQGGGIYASGTAMLTLNDTTIDGNTADTFGGGIAADGSSGGIPTVALNNSTVSGNTATNSQGGGIHNTGAAILTLTNTTVSGNTADTFGGGINNDTGVVTVTHSTITDNTVLAGFGQGGGMEVNGATTLSSSIVAGNSAPGGNANCDGGTPVTSADYNLDDDNTCGLAQPNDIPSGNANLGPLQNNGGPTFTHELLPGSDALDQIPDGVNGCGTSPLDEDQRGGPRPETPGALCDIGAFELTVPLTVTRAYAWAGASASGRVAYTGVLTDLDPLAGLSFIVSDALSLNESGSVAPGDCAPQPFQRIKCRSKDPVIKGKRVRGVFRPTGNPGELRFKVRMNKLSVPLPQAGPLALAITEMGGFTAVGSNANCVAHSKRLVCKN